MHTPRSLLLHVDHGARLEQRIAIASLLSARFDARVNAHYAPAPLLVGPPPPLDVGAAEIASQRVLRISAERRSVARALFDAAAEGSDRFVWTEALGAAFESLVRMARLSDLTLLGQTDPDDAASGEPGFSLAPELLAASGRPALVVPYAGPVATIGEHVLVAWKDSAESARALAAAMPWLLGARRVTVTSFGRDAQTALDGVAAYLRTHGIEAARRPYGEEGGRVGAYLLSEAADCGADLLVMGCYGHSRLRERLLGGATRSILEAMTVPVLMMH